MRPELCKVIVVEDNHDIRGMILKAALEMVGGLEVRACESGTEALDAIAEFAPQLMLLDVMMPDLDGPGVLGRLRQRPDTAALPAGFPDRQGRAVGDRAIAGARCTGCPYQAVRSDDAARAGEGDLGGQLRIALTANPIFLGRSGNFDSTNYRISRMKRLQVA